MKVVRPTRALFQALVFLVLVARVQANLVLDWDGLMLNAIRVDDTGPTLSSRNLAILHLAIYDAVNSVTRSHQPYHVQLDVPAGTSAEAAVVAAGHEVMGALYPSYQARTEDLYQMQLAALPATSGTTNGLNLGVQVARELLNLRTSDGANTQVPYIPSAAPGQWRRTPPFFRPPLDPQWRYVTLFALPEKETFLPPPPPAMTSEEYAAGFNELKSLGVVQSPNRTPEQRDIAVFWSDFSYTAMPPGHWHEIAAAIVRNQGTSFEDSARLFALLSLAQADAAIVCWECKYRYNTWRPSTAIQRAAEDNNPATDPDATWTSLLVSPPFPEYTSGHSTFSKASAEVLTQFYGTDGLTFTATSDALPGVFRTFTSLAACADEVGRSRIYGGIHFEFSNREGKRSGAKIGDYVAANWLLANSELPSIHVEDFTNDLPVLRLHGHIGATCVVDTSADLAQWLPIATNTAVPGGVPITVPNLPSDFQFYRVREP